MNDLVVVGGGVLGTAHALAGCDLGWRVTHIEREAAPRGASVRNFGLVWVSGRAGGHELEMALDARQRWEALGARHARVGFRPNGSLTVAATPGEEAVLEETARLPDADLRGLELLGSDEARRVTRPSARSGPRCTARPTPWSNRDMSSARSATSARRPGDTAGSPIER